DFLEQRERIDDHPVADHGKLPRSHDPGRQQRQLVGDSVDDQRVTCIMSTLEANDDVGLLRQPVDDLAFPLAPPWGPNHDHMGHEAAFLRVGGARETVEATKVSPPFGPLPRGSYLSRQANAAATAPAVRSQLPDFAGLIHPLPSPTPSTADDFALSKAISRQHRGGDGFAVRPKTALLPSMRANPARRPARTGAGRRAVLASAAGNPPNADATIPPVCEPAHIGWRRRVSSLGPQGPGGS